MNQAIEPLTIVTGWSPKGWTEYARRFYETFEEFWPNQVKLIAYGEERPSRPMPRCEFRSLESIPGCMAFLQRYRGNAQANGREPAASWKARERQAGYSFRFDAWKFCRQGFIPWHAAQTLETPLMAWLDADVVTYKPVPRGTLEQLLPADKDLAYLGRGAKHSEIGFQLYRLTRERERVTRTYQMLALFKDLYATEAVFDLKEWHSAYCFDHARVVWMGITGGHAHNLTPQGRSHVWLQSPLQPWMHHDKGDRKYKRTARGNQAIIP